MQSKEIHQHFEEIQHLMAELFKTYETLKPASNTAENTVVTTLKTLHESFQNAFLLSLPQTDADLNAVVGGMRSYLLVTQTQVDELKKLAKSAKSDLSAITQKRDEVKTWSDEMAKMLTSPPAVPTNATSAVPSNSTDTEAVNVPDPARNPNPPKNGLAVLLGKNPTGPDDNLFVDILVSQNGANATVVTQTKDLFNGIIDDSVTDQTIPALVTSWQNVITTFVQQFKASPGGDITIMTGLVELHSLLEILYDQLLPNITQTSGDSLDNRILSIY